MKKIMILGILVLLLIINFSVIGETAVINKLVTIPTTSVMTYQGSISAEFLSDRKAFEVSYKLDDRLEVGGIMELYENESKYKIGPLVKLALTPETSNQPAITGGLQNDDMYVVFSKTLKYGFKGHIGVGNGRYDNIFVGVNKVINPVTVTIDGNQGNNSSAIPPMNLMAEYVDQEINLGLRVNFAKNIYADLGVMNLNSLKAGVSFVF